MLKFSEFSDAPQDMGFYSAKRQAAQHVTETRQLRVKPNPEGPVPTPSARCIRRVTKSINCKSFNLMNIDSFFIDAEP